MTLPNALIIEDDAHLAEIFTEAVLEAGYQPHHCADGADAVNQIDALSPQLFLVDLHLPGLNGEQIVDHIRETGNPKRCWIIVVSADSHWVDTMRHKVDFTLDKPVSYRQLKSLVERLKFPV